MPNIGAVILAAGESSRLGQPKQLIQFRGKTLVRRIVDAAREAGCSPKVVVIGSDKDKMARELEQTNTVIVENVNWKNGMGTSIRSAVQHLIDIAPNVEASVLLVCDQPFVDSRTIEQLIALREKTKKAVVASNYATRWRGSADSQSFEAVTDERGQGFAVGLVANVPSR
jgi:molybdenum cofactor cytidylyltransferase